MSSVVLSGDTSGTVTVTVPAVAGSNIVTIPAGTGTAAVQGVSTNIVSGTSVASTSGTSIDFTGIPSWVKRITVLFNNVSTSGTSYYLVQLGSGSVQTTGYQSTSDDGAAATTSTAGMIIITGLAAWQAAGSMSIHLLSGNSYVTNHVAAQNNSGASAYCSRGGGTVTLSGLLDRVRITTVNGTDTFDNGSINILYE